MFKTFGIATSFILFLPVFLLANPPKKCFNHTRLQSVILSAASKTTNYFDRVDAGNKKRSAQARKWSDRLLDRAIDYRLNLHSTFLIKNPYSSNGELLRALNQSNPALVQVTNYERAVRLETVSFSASGREIPVIPPKDITENPNLEEIIKNNRRMQTHWSQDRINQNGQAFTVALKVSDPLVWWLLKQKKGQVEPYELVKKALEMYNNDFLTAMGVIGFIFEEERRNAFPRNKTAILGTRIKPLFCDLKDDPIGYNYHFWAYMNLALQGGGTAESTFNYFFQKVYQKDLGDYWANKLGIELGKMALSHTSRVQIRDILFTSEK